MTNGGEPRHSLAERGDEFGVFDDRLGKFEELDLVAGLGIDAVNALAEPVGDRRRGRDS